jgi:hypothetical protein
MSEIKKYQKAMNFKANPRYLTRDFMVPLYTGTEPDILDDSNTQRESSVYKEFPNEMPIVSPKEIQNQPYEQLELADGGSVERQGFKTGGDVQNWVKETYPNVNFDFEKYPNTGVGSSDKNYAMVKKAINKKLENPNYFKPSLDKGINNIADAFLKSYAKDDVSYLTSKSEFNKNGMLSSNDVSFYRAKTKSPTFVQDIVDKTGLKAEDVLDLMDERENFIELDIKPEIAGQTKLGNTIQINKSIDQGEDWLIKNSKNYENVEDLKKGFKRVFGKDHPFLRQTLRTVHGMPKLNPLFYEGKQKSYQTHGAPAFTYGTPEMKNLFQASLYNFNPTIRDKVLNELNDILPKTKITENQKYDLRKKFQNSKILSELGINKRLSGPVTRLLIKDLGENVVEDINFVRYPRTEVGHYINFLKDKVDPKYKKQFELVNKAIRQLNYKNYNGAKDTLGIVENINLDHRVPKYLIDAGYADEIEYIKLNPIGEKFNMIAKNKNFDAPIARLSRKYEATNNPEDKAKIIKEMNNIKDNFNKRYNNYLSDINIKEVGGKLNVSSSLKPITSADEFVKTLGTNVKQNPEFFKLDKKIKDQMIANIGCPTIGKSLGGRVNFSEGSNCYAKGLEKIKSGELNMAERTIAGDFLKEAGAGDEIVNGILKGGKKSVGVLEDFLGFGKGVVGRTITPLVAANSALEQLTTGNYREAYRQAFDFLDPLPLIGVSKLEKARQEGSIENVRSRIGKENQESFNRLLEVRDVFDKLEDVNTKLERVISATQDPNAAPESYDPDYINDLKKQQKDLNKIINTSKYQNIRDDFLNVGNALSKETYSRNIDKPIQEKTVYDTANLETLNRIFGSNFLNQFEDENKIIFKNLTASEKINEQPIPAISDEQRTIIEEIGARGGAAEGGRIGLSGGGGPKMGRRGFLGLLTGIAAAPELIKSIKGTKKAAQIAKVLPKVSGMPEWFPSLIAKIEKEGKFPFSDYATTDNVKIKELVIPSKIEKGVNETYIMTKYPDGRIEIQANIKGGAFDSPFELHYTPPKSDIDVTTGKVIKEPGEFNVVEQRPRPVGWEGSDLEIDYENMSVKDAISDIERIEETITGKILDPKIANERSAARKIVHERPYEDVINRYPDPDTGGDWWER